MGYAPQPKLLTKGFPGVPASCHNTDTEASGRCHRTPSVTRGSNRYCRAQHALLRLNLPTARSQPTGPGARAPADWLIRRASSSATSRRGGAGPSPGPRPTPPPPRPGSPHADSGEVAGPSPKPLTGGHRYAGILPGLSGGTLSLASLGIELYRQFLGSLGNVPLRSSGSQLRAPPPRQADSC